MTSVIDTIELKDFVSTVLSEIEQGVDIETRAIKGDIEFEVTVEKTSRMGGDIKIYVANGKKESSSEHVARIKFSVFPKESERSKSETAEVLRHNQEMANKWRDW